MFKFSIPDVRSARLRRLLLVLFLLSAASSMLAAPPSPPPVTFNGAASNVPITASDILIGLAVDPAGDAYVSFGQSGLVKIAAGTGVQTAISATGLNYPAGLALDAAGDLFVVDSGNNRVVELPAGGGTQIAMGSGLNSPYGVAVDAAGNVFIADCGNSRVVEIPAGGGKQVKVPATGLTTVQTVAVDSLGNLYIAETGSVQELPWTGSAWGKQFTVPFTGLNTPLALTVDSAGDVFVADFVTGLIQESFASGGQALVGSGFVNPSGLGLDGLGNVYVADQGTGLVTKIQLHNANFGSQAVGSASATSQLTFTVSSGVKVGSIGILTQGAAGLDFADAGSSTCTAKTYSSTTTCVVNVAFTPRAAGPRNGAVVLFSGPKNTGTPLAAVPIYGVGTGPQIAYQPAAVATLSSGYSYNIGIAVDGNNNVFVADELNNTVYEVAPNGTQTTYSSGYNRLSGLAVDGAGNLFIANTLPPAVYELTPNGVQTTVGGGGWSSPTGVAVDGQGNVYAVDEFKVVKVTPAGARIPVGSGFSQPQGLAVDSGGNVYVTDTGLKNVSKVTPNGTQTVLASGFQTPFGVAVDAAGDVYVADTDGFSITEITPAGGQAILSNNSNRPNYIAIDGLGDLYRSDNGDGSIVEMQRSLPPTVTFPTKTSVGSTDTADGAQTVQIANVGNQPLVFTGLTYPTDFPESEKLPAVAPDAKPGLCTGSESLGAAEYCFLNIDFSPLSGGTLSETVTLTDNALNVAGATQSIPVQGTGIITTQTINFPAIPAQIIGTSWTLSATATSGLTVSFTSLTTSVCSVSGVKASFIAVGTCTIQATQPGNSSYTAAKSVNQSFPVNGANQTITFPLVGAQTVGATLTLPATASSGLPVSYTSLTPSTCSVSGSTASLIGAGVCRFKASQPGNSAYSAAPDVYQYFLVNLKTQTVSFPQPPTQHLLANYTLSATATSSLSVSFTSSTPAVCTVSGTTLTPVAVGTCSVTAVQAGNSTYASAGLLQNFHVALANQTINFTAPANGSVGAKLTLSATASSGLTVSYASFSPSICTVSGNALTLVSSGPCSIQASQPGNATYAAAPVINQTIKVLGY